MVIVIILVMWYWWDLIGIVITSFPPWETKKEIALHSFTPNLMCKGLIRSICTHTHKHNSLSLSLSFSLSPPPPLFSYIFTNALWISTPRLHRSSFFGCFLCMANLCLKYSREMLGRGNDFVGSILFQLSRDLDLML